MSITSLSAFISSMSAPKTASSKSKACGGYFPNPLTKLLRLALFLAKLVLPPALFENSFSIAIPKYSSVLVFVLIATNNKNIKNKQEQSNYLYTLVCSYQCDPYTPLYMKLFAHYFIHTYC